MSTSRGGLQALLKKFAITAIEQDDQKYGRQLATICEQVAASLRVQFGGKSRLTLTMPAARPEGLAPPRITRASETFVVPERSSEDEQYLADLRRAYAQAEPAKDDTIPANIKARVVVRRQSVLKWKPWGTPAMDDVRLASDGSITPVSIWPVPTVDNLRTDDVPLAQVAQGDE